MNLNSLPTLVTGTGLYRTRGGLLVWVGAVAPPAPGVTTFAAKGNYIVKHGFRWRIGEYQIWHISGRLAVYRETNNDLVAKAPEELESMKLAGWSPEGYTDLDLRRGEEMLGYLHHGEGTEGPFRTESVRVVNEYADRWLARFEGRWRRVYIQVNRLYIVYRGEKITIQIDGV